MSEMPNSSKSRDEQAYLDYVGSPGTVHKPPPKRPRLTEEHPIDMTETLRRSTERLDLEPEPRSIDVFALSDSQEGYSTAPESQGTDEAQAKRNKEAEKDDEVVKDSADEDDRVMSDVSIEIEEKSRVNSVEPRTPSVRRDHESAKNSPANSSSPAVSGGRTSGFSRRSADSDRHNVSKPPSARRSNEGRASEPGDPALDREDSDVDEEERVRRNKKLVSHLYSKRFQALAQQHEALDDVRMDEGEVGGEMENREELPRQEGVRVQDHFDKLLTEFDTENLVLPPNVKEADGYFDYVYAQLPRIPNNFIEHDDPLEDGTALLKLEWSTDQDRETNLTYAYQKTLLDDYIAHGTETSYHLFAGLIEDMVGAGNRELEFTALERWFQEESELKGEKEVLTLLRNIVKVAACTVILPSKIYKLQGSVQSATFSQKQCAVLVARMFFNFGDQPFRCPDRKSQDGRVRKHFAFYTILSMPTDLAVEKIRFIMNYFETFFRTRPDGLVSFRRTNGYPYYAEDLLQCTNRVNASVSYDMKIENSALCSQVDFANKKLGGGVLTHGAVQEEIRFLCCPEMLVGLLLCTADMNQNEAISIVGAQCYSSYTGYGSTLRWAPLTDSDARQNNYRDEHDRIRIECVAIDALNFTSLNVSNNTPKFPGSELIEQLDRRHLLREINKAIVGFRSAGTEFENIPIVSGWWGCGAFGGDKVLKFFIQAVAAGVVKRPLIICPFDSRSEARMCATIMNEITERNLTVGSLFKALRRIPRPTHRVDSDYVYKQLKSALESKRDDVPSTSGSRT